MTVLIVEDNPGIRKLLRRTLSDAFEAVWECTAGAEALDAYTTHRPDIVVMDVRMPDMDGLAATRQILDSDPNARIVMVTDFDDEAIRCAAFQQGARGYLLKECLLDLNRMLLSIVNNTP